jgi:hypothetical protein
VSVGVGVVAVAGCCAVPFTAGFAGGRQPVAVTATSAARATPAAKFFFFIKNFFVKCVF